MCQFPALMRATLVVVRPVVVSTAAGVSTGLAAGLQVLLPIWEVSSSPQQYARPAVVTAQVCPHPAEIWATLVVVSPVVVSTAVGVLRAVLGPSPIWALSLAPKQYACPAVVHGAGVLDPGGDLGDVGGGQPGGGVHGVGQWCASRLGAQLTAVVVTPAVRLPPRW